MHFTVDTLRRLHAILEETRRAEREAIIRYGREVFLRQRYRDSREVGVEAFMAAIESGAHEEPREGGGAVHARIPGEG